MSSPLRNAYLLLVLFVIGAIVSFIYLVRIGV